MGLLNNKTLDLCPWADHVGVGGLSTLHIRRGLKANSSTIDRQRTVLMTDDKQTTVNSIGFGWNCSGTIPVSYTHLDVYKRQKLLHL